MIYLATLSAPAMTRAVPDNVRVSEYASDRIHRNKKTRDVQRHAMSHPFIGIQTVLSFTTIHNGGNDSVCNLQLISKVSHSEP